VRSAADLADLDAFTERLRAAAPMIADDSIDVIVSNCVLNLVKDTEKKKLFDELKEIAAAEENVTLLCTCKEEERRCHRHLLSAMLRDGS